MPGLLIALADCSQAPAGGNRSALPPVPAENLIAPDTNTATAMPPAQGTGQVGAPSVPDPGHAPPARFVVCPGNPRCPPEGSRPGGRRPSGR